jgi:enoyl-[acyl-carrier protein] reductase III
MSLDGKFALVTGSSRGIGRGIALKLAERGARVAVHYVRNEQAARDVLSLVRARGSDGFLVQADVCVPEEIHRMFYRVQNEFGALDIFVSNARPEMASFYQPPAELTLAGWSSAMTSQATAFLEGARQASAMMRSGGRIVAITYAGGGRYGSWQPWVAMGAAKSAMESLCRYFAVALARRGITVNAVSPGWTAGTVLYSWP